jgi:hypothetical protein
VTIVSEVTVRRLIGVAVAVPVALLTLLPPVGAADELAPPPPASDAGGFHGFGSFDTHAQGQVATLTAFLNAFREDNRLVGAVSEINGPPANARNIAALVQRGQAATFIYGVIGGPGGARGSLPDPPPGEAAAFFPSGPPESSFNGPITGAGVPQVVDGQFHAKATEFPTGRSEGAVTKLVDPGYFTVEQATVVSHTEPGDAGVTAEAVSVLRQVAVGPLLIQSLVSRAYAFVPATGDPKGIAFTVVEGATVNGTPVQVTDRGIVAADQANPLGQEQINQAMANAGFPQVRLLPSIAKPGDDHGSMSSTAGVLEVVKQDEKFGASNPQGVAGGGFSIGGAEAVITSAHCVPNCPGVGGEGDLLGGPPESGGPAGPSEAPSPSPATATASGTAESTGATPSPDSTSFTSTPDTGHSAGSETGGYSSLPSSGGGFNTGGGPSFDYSSTTSAVTPPSLDAAIGGRSSPAVGPVQQKAAAATSTIDPKTAAWVRDLYLMVGLAAGILFVAQRLARAF